MRSRCQAVVRHSQDDQRKDRVGMALVSIKGASRCHEKKVAMAVVDKEVRRRAEAEPEQTPNRVSSHSASQAHSKLPHHSHTPTSTLLPLLAQQMLDKCAQDTRSIDMPSLWPWLSVSCPYMRLKGPA